MDTIVPEKVGFSSARLGRIHAYMQRHVDNGTVPGTITLLARHGKVAHFECYGLDAFGGKPMGPDAIFRIYSMSKPITCVALMMLFEEGLFQLTDPVAAYIPAFGKVKVFVRQTDSGMELAELQRPITIHDLLTHTAGLSYGFLPDDPVDALYRQTFQPRPGKRMNVPLSKAVDMLATLPLAHQPGAAFRYSYAHDVVGYLVEILSGMPFERFLKERIFGPLGMVDTGFFVPKDKLHCLTALYSATPAKKLTLVDDPAKTVWADPDVTPSGGGGLLSTIGDYLRFAQMLLNGGILDGVRLLSPRTIALMTRNHLPSQLLPYSVGTGQPRYGFGYGLGVGVLMNATEADDLAAEGAYHWNGAASTRWWNDPKEDLIGLMMIQILQGELLPPLGQTFRNLAYQAIDE